jgi:hypothetical protein
MKKSAGWLSASLLCATAAQAGVVVHFSSKSLPGGQPKNDQIMYAQDGMLRIDKLDDQGHVRDITILRDGLIWSVNVPAHTFRKIDKSAMAAQHGAMEDKMKAYVQNLPPERRAMFEQRMASLQQNAHDYSVSDSGRSEHVGSYTCEVWQASRDGKVFTENCIAPQGGIPGGEELVKAAHNGSAIATDVISAMPQAARMMDPMYALYGKMNGFPVLVRFMSGTVANREETATAIEKQSLPADQFAIPKGFTEAPLGAPDAR